MLKKIVSKLFFLAVRVIGNTATHTRDRFNIALGRHKLVYAETSGRLLRPENPKRVAVVALYPNRYLVPFIVNLMKGLERNGFFVLAVASKRLSGDISSPLLDHCHVLIERFPIGKDFGSYKMGIEWIGRQPSLKNLETLALVNDSLYYPASIGDTIHDLLSLGKDWLALYENHEIEYHAQSFFQVFRKPILDLESFKSFWSTYKPLSSRMYFIEKGEKGITRVLLKSGFLPSVLYDSLAIRNSSYRDLLQGGMHSDIYAVVERTLNREGSEFEPSRVFSDFNAGNPAGNNGSLDGAFTIAKQWDWYAKNVALQVARLAENHNPTHATGLLCNMLFLAPIKRDICLKGCQHPISELLQFARGFSDSEKTAMMDDLRMKGLPSSARPYSWRWIKLAAVLE